MSRARLGVAIAGVATLALLATTFVDCAQPTQIIVEVYSDACPGGGKTQVINSTGIAVGTAANIDEVRPSAYRDGCDNAPAVGSLTVYPSGNNDDEVALKVVSGVDKTPDRCDPPDYSGCIVHRRMMRFVPHTTQHAVVQLTLACLNRTCPLGTTCDNGACISDRDVLDDGGTRDDASRIEAGVTEGGTEGGIVDAGFDACTGCKGTCDNTTGCVVNCTTPPCTGEQCAPGLPCKITCGAAGTCPDVLCTTSQKCTVDCSGAAKACGRVTCNAGDCAVTCNGANTCNSPDGGLFLDAGNTATLTCTGDNACNTASCNATTCTLTCKDNGPKSACPAPRPCSGGCAAWPP